MSRQLVQKTHVSGYHFQKALEFVKVLLKVAIFEMSIEKIYSCKIIFLNKTCIYILLKENYFLPQSVPNQYLLTCWFSFSLGNHAQTLNVTQTL